MIICNAGRSQSRYCSWRVWLRQELFHSEPSLGGKPASWEPSMDSVPTTRSQASKRLKVNFLLFFEWPEALWLIYFSSSDLDLQNERMPPRKDASSEVTVLLFLGTAIKPDPLGGTKLLLWPLSLLWFTNHVLQASPVDGPAKTTNNSHAFSSWGTRSSN